MINYYMPTKVYFGSDSLKTHSNTMKNFGNKALIVTGRNSSKKNGSLTELVGELETLGINYVIFDEIEENPSLETILRGAEVGKSSGVDFLIGLGGGSPIDASKAMGIYIKTPNLKDDDIFKFPNLDSLPIIAIPTTSGTGTEVTQYSIITVHKEQTKKNFGQSVFPKIAFIDPKYTYNTPVDITINTAIDAFTHLAEGYLNTNSTIISDSLAEKGFVLFSESIDDLLRGNITTTTREKLMMASTLAGMVIAQTGTSLPHGLGYALTYNKGLPHGIANGILFAEYLKAFKFNDKVLKMLSIMGLESISDFEHLFDSLITHKVQIDIDEIKSYTNSFIMNKAKLKNHPESISYDEIYLIYKKSLIK